MSDGSLELMLFETSGAGAQAMIRESVPRLLVDWETVGKHTRQAGYDTEIEPQSVATLEEIAQVAPGRTWCRVNRIGPYTKQEVDEAIAAGATGIFLPMVRHPEEVDSFLRAVNERCETGILIETVDAMACLADLSQMPLSRVYFGLNDFAISRGHHFIFTAVLDGSVQRAREAFAGTPFGFGGVTAVERGDPVPCARLIEEMERLNCQFTFMRRSFRRDINDVTPRELMEGVQRYWTACRNRSQMDRVLDRQNLEALLRELSHAKPPFA